jgi:hypothetical protein
MVQDNACDRQTTETGLEDSAVFAALVPQEIQKDCTTSTGVFAALTRDNSATALIHNLTVVARNTDHFAPTGARLLNPFAQSGCGHSSKRRLLHRDLSKHLSSVPPSIAGVTAQTGFSNTTGIWRLVLIW